MNNEVLIKTAQDLINNVTDDQTHTVASAIHCTDGSVVTGINLYHFNGGPCGELVALANVAAQKKQPQLLVAVGHNNRGVIAPCGRCRQVMFDYYPDIEVLVPDNQEILTKKITDLLPYTFDWVAQ